MIQPVIVNIRTSCYVFHLKSIEVLQFLVNFIIHGLDDLSHLLVVNFDAWDEFSNHDHLSWIDSFAIFHQQFKYFFLIVF